MRDAIKERKKAIALIDNLDPLMVWLARRLPKKLVFTIVALAFRQCQGYNLFNKNGIMRIISAEDVLFGAYHYWKPYEEQ